MRRVVGTVWRAVCEPEIRAVCVLLVAVLDSWRSVSTLSSPLASRDVAIRVSRALPPGLVLPTTLSYLRTPTHATSGPGMVCLIVRQLARAPCGEYVV